MQAAGGEGGADSPPKIRSAQSKKITWVQFTNLTKRRASVYWLNYQGEKKVYHPKVKPGETYWQHTYVSHPWIACHNSTGALLAMNTRLVHIPTDDSHFAVNIQEPACLPWSPKTHCRYPPTFKSAVRTLLLCHHRARSEQPVAQGATSLRRSTRLAVKRMRKENDPLGLSLAELPSELITRIVQFMVPAGILDVEHVPGEESLPGYDKLMKLVQQP